MFSPGRSVNLQDCSFPSCSSYPPHILKNRRVSRRDTRLALRIYIYICTPFSFDFFFRASLRFASFSSEFPPRRRREIRQPPNYHPSFFRLECYRDMLSRKFFESSRNLRLGRGRSLDGNRRAKRKRREESAVKKRSILVHGGRVE